MKRMMATALLMFAALPASTTHAHTGSDESSTSNYRSRITAVEPAVDGLEVSIVNLDGVVEVTWEGTGTLTVEGYEGEPYLRFSASGVERNRRSPATYLNEDRYADVALPEQADGTAAPEWELVASTPTFSWHDHRSHWMSPTPPAGAGGEGDFVIAERWEIQMHTDTADVVVAGDLVLLESPNAAPWWIAALVLGGAAFALLRTGRWRTGAAALAVCGTAVFAVDSVGYYVEGGRGLAAGLWLFVPPVVAGAASVRLALHARRGTAQPTISMAIAAIVLGVAGGWDRADVFSHALVNSAWPVWLPRVSAAMCLAIGAALLARFLVFLVPPLLRAPQPTRKGDLATASR